MVLMDWQTALKWAGSGVLAMLLASSGVVSASSKSEQPAPAPAVRIRVDSLGYLPPSQTYMGLRLAMNTLDFIDSGHLLFTFHANRLMPRLPSDRPSDDDQIIHAEVLDIASGKVTQEADWRMHDRQRYLWALNGGRFLVRQRNSLFITDEHLQLRPYLAFSTDLEAVALSPDRKLMLLELAMIVSPPSKPERKAPSLLGPGDSAGTSASESAPRTTAQRRTELILLRPGTNTVVARSEAAHTVDLPLTDDGFIGLAEGQKENEWALIKTDFSGKPNEFGTVRSSCMPELEPLSETVVMASHCSPKTPDDREVTAVSTDKGVLWRDVWSNKYVWPNFKSSPDGSRFAYESLETIRPIGTLEPPDQENVKDQPVGVFDTESGKLDMVEDASPVLSGGGNFALSEDGRQFAILRRGAIEVYDLPPVAGRPGNSSR